MFKKNNQNVLILGSGGREYALAYALSKSSTPLNIFFTGWANPGLLQLGTLINLEDILCQHKSHPFQLAVIGPEAYLAEGWVDKLQEHGIPCFGPRKLLAMIETSKKTGRWLVDKINTQWNPEYLVCNPEDFQIFPEKEILAFIEMHQYQYVIKKDGLCGGKGVKVSGVHLETVQDGLNYCRELYENQEVFLLEEKLNGEEFSLHSVTDGNKFLHMPLVKDYKKAYDNETGPNTGSMGSLTFANHSLPFLSEEDLLRAQSINESAINALQEYYHEGIEGGYETGYRGVLYGSFIKTGDPEQPIKVIEFNVRFGDPECINLLSIFQGDVYQLLLQTAHGTLDKFPEETFTFDQENTVVKYLVPNGYPHNPVKGFEIYLNNMGFKESETFPASVEYHMPKNHNVYDKGHLYLGGSRAIAFLAKGDSSHILLSKKLNEDLNKVWGPVFYRKDIGYHTLPVNVLPANKYSYQKSGVNLTTYQKALQSIKSHVEATYNSHVLSQFGDFGGVYEMPGNSDNVLVASTDGVGTKSRYLLSNLDTSEAFETLGMDIVNHSVNDILVMGAYPLFFLDYYASATVCQDHLAYLLKGMSEGCQKSNTVILGGETAEMPGIYQTDQVDIVGTIVGTAKKTELLIPKDKIEEGDYVLAFPSSGIHTNGYSLVRQITDDHKPPAEIQDKLCQPHRSYLPHILKIREYFKNKFPNKVFPDIIHGLCHITGGGLIDNPARVLREDLTLRFQEGSWEMPEEFKFLQEKGNLSKKEMYNVFNCGLGMLVIISPTLVSAFAKLFKSEECFLVGKIEKREEGGKPVIF